ncbi:MAG: hypothetical protein WA775_12170 [Psychroserpens sp.]|uniref:hypothetical protein n=1 Tax=Psychroserpens sp. TaxID=2020870 RepID=UPI003C71B075
MKNDFLDNLFKDLEGAFDIESPNTGHQNRFLDKLISQRESLPVSKSRTLQYWKPILAVAASIILGLSIFGVMQQQEQDLSGLASVSPEMSQTQSFFTFAIEQELAAIQAKRSPETEQMITDALSQLKSLENDYNQLNSDLIESGNDQRVIYAMITNFQNRIVVLETVMTDIKDLNTIKNNENATTTF